MAVQEITETPYLRSSDASTSPVTRQQVPGIRLRAPDNTGHTPGTRFLGWFSIGLGVAEIVMPRKLLKMIGAPPNRTLTTRFMGLREVGVGIGLLSSARPSGWLKARFAGDIVDLLALKRSFSSPRAQPLKLSLATASVAAITAADIAFAMKTNPNPPNGQLHLECSMAINRSPEDCYAYWHKLENLPAIIENLQAVHVTGEKTSHWSVKAAGKTFDWDAEMIQDVPNELIAWRSSGRGNLRSNGSVRFERRVGGPGTIMRVKMDVLPPASGATNTIAPRVLQNLSEHHVREGLRRFKSVIEAGEFPTIKGQPTGKGRE